MKRTLLGSMIVAVVFLGAATRNAAGRDDEPEKVSLADLKPALLRKMVAAHAAGFAADKANEAQAKALAETVGGAAAVAGKLDYAYEGDKPSVVLDASKLEREVAPADRDAALVALKGLVGYALNKVADASIKEGEEKFTLAKADAKTLAGAARIRWRAGPPPADASKILAGRLAALAKELESLKKVEARIAKLEKDAPEAAKKFDDLAPQIRKIADSIKELEKLHPSVQKLEESLKKLEPLPDQVKALTDRATRQDKAIADAAAALEKQRAEAAVALQKLRADNATTLKQQRDEIASAMKKFADETNVTLLKQNDAVKILTDKLARTDDLAAAQAKQTKLAEAEAKKLDARLKRAEAILFPPPIQYRVVDRGHYTLAPSQNVGRFGECYPTLTPVWVPCPVYVPIQPTVEESRPGPPARPQANASLPVPPTRSPPAGKASLRPAVPVYHTDGLKAADAGAIYARGVQLYYAGESAEALARFDAAIRLDGADARSWYFKSLSETALGDAVAAAKSLDRAAGLHLQNKPTADEVGLALERIQGPARLQFREALDAQRVRR